MFMMQLDATTEAVLRDVGLVVFIIVSGVGVIGLLGRTIFQLSKNQAQIAELQLAQDKVEADRSATISTMYLETIAALNKNIAENTLTVNLIGQQVKQNTEQAAVLVREGHAVQQGLMESIDAQRAEYARSRTEYEVAKRSYGSLEQGVATSVGQVTSALEGVKTQMAESIEKKLEEIRQQYEQTNAGLGLLGKALDTMESMKNEDIKFIRDSIGMIMDKLASMSDKLETMQVEIDDVVDDVATGVSEETPESIDNLDLENKEKKSDEH